VRLAWVAEHTAFEDLAQDYYSQGQGYEESAGGLPQMENLGSSPNQNRSSASPFGMNKKGGLDLPDF
jgi:hypothetical protein